METNNEDDKNTKLIRLLESNPDFLPDDMEISKPNTTSTSYKRTHEGNCQECEDTPAILKCEQCNDVFCDLCFKSQHRKGKRTKHTIQKLFEQKEEITKELPTVEKLTSQLERGKGHYDYRYKDSQFESIGAEKIGDYMMERCKYIPLRLSLKERKALRLVEAALNVSEYTDRIDHLRFKNSAQRLHSQLQEICAVLLGIGVAAEYNVGQELMESKNFKDFAEFFQGILENGRRHKIMNPEKMRTEYGKLIYILQDSVSEEAQELVGFNLVKPIKTVYSLLLSHDSQALLQDPNILIATREITPDNKNRSEIQREIKQKEAAIEFLSKKYAKGGMDQEMIRQCLYSIGDNNSFLAFNRDPVDKMIEYLKRYFSAEKVEDGFTLAISGGHDGSRLTHSHERQYFYVLQSLSLWSEVLHDMFKLWCLAEEDLLDPTNSYVLKDTGQGLQRVQQAGKIYKAISKILMATQQKVGTWVGSSVIHLGDHNVPNALMFIDKYTQVPRILGPVVKTIEQVEVLAKDPGIKEYIDSTFGNVEECRKEILGDFFRHAFDGSGADNFFDAGSCIDGRLTSAWNWCSKIDQKRFYPIFKLTGFVGFDGDFQK